ncbi:class I SAM-dependent methyltransferase [Burkholderia humptydooensis]|uniref:Class I SAM-dependent methyltransferase n=1 Tax=Burkholderia humptydooensis TaxID=430531 RepID=A0A7U4SVK7_9BURK|nr:MULTISPECIES: class I SAM-dependent methyltransferase [Burkholderia]AJY40229.1 methyltransferase domain protein [Burkholderia sp. 2002721687]ALX45976.1 methyltransferase [Burkholderia humptydooensis]QPS47472.1 class I SAM-dependent methyltransferase [Burkholderia humptydooensis]
MTTTFSGPLFDLVDDVLRDAPEYRGFRAGAQSRAEFAAFLERVRTQLVGRGVPSNDVHFAKRFPASIDAAVEHAFAGLAPTGLAWPAEFPAVCAQVAASIGRGFDHQGLGTYIYPEEGRLLLAVALAFRPRNAVFLGSYYGYWAAWALPAIVACGGGAVLVDPDPRVADVARRSLARLYPDADARVEVVCDTGEHYLARGGGPFDLVVLDAELPRDHRDPTRRGKGIYAHLLRAVLPRLAPRSLLVCHNILFRDHSGCAFFDDVIARNRDELAPFVELVAREYDCFVECPTTEGVGVGMRTSMRDRA